MVEVGKTMVEVGKTMKGAGMTIKGVGKTMEGTGLQMECLDSFQKERQNHDLFCLYYTPGRCLPFFKGEEKNYGCS